MSDQSQKTEQPTPQRKEKARKEGNFPVSKEFVSAVQFTAFVALMGAYGSAWLASLQQMMRGELERAFEASLTTGEVVQLVLQLSFKVFLPIGLIGASLCAVSLAFQLATTGFGWSLKKLAPDFQRFNPASKLKDLPKQNAWMLFQSAAMLIIFGYIIYRISSENAEAFFLLPLTGLLPGMKVVFVSMHNMVWKMTTVILLFGCVDLFRQRKKFSDSMMMSKHDIKEEMKENDGNPQTKMRLRRLQRDMRRKRMMKDLETATAVIVNPTHYAVAIRYDHESMSAPRVVAKGRDYLALRIRRKALELGIPLVENKPLAQGLYKAVEVGQDIPPQLYRAVAEILAYIYSLSKEARF